MTLALWHASTTCLFRRACLFPQPEKKEQATQLADYSNTYKSSPDCHIYIESLQDLGDDADRYADELDNQISVDELSTNAP